VVFALAACSKSWVALASVGYQAALAFCRFDMSVCLVHDVLS